MNKRKAPAFLGTSLAVLVLGSAVCVSAATVPPAPRLWLGFDGNLSDKGTSTLAHSVFGTNLSASYTGTFDPGVVNATAGVDTLSLSGDNSFVEVTNVDDVNFDTGNPFTITTWINMGSLSSGAIIGRSPYDTNGSVSLLDDTGAQAFELFVGGDLSPGRGQVTVGNFGVWEIESSASVNDGNWHHVAVTYDGFGNWNLYIDGGLDVNGSGPACNEADTMANGSPDLGPWPLSIGYAGNEDFPATFAGLDGGQFDTTTMAGKIDEVAVWDKCLTDAQIAEVYSGGVPFQTIDITQEPQTTGAFTTHTATLSLLATPVILAGPLSYQWTSNGVNIVGEPSALTASYTTPTLTSSFDGAQYACLITAGSVSVLSSPATLNVVTPVLPPAPALWLPLNNSFADLGAGAGAHTISPTALSGSFDGTFSPDVANATAGSDSLSLTGSATDESFVKVTGGSDLNFDTGHPLSVSFWVNMDGAANGAIFGKSPDDGGASDTLLDDLGAKAFSIFVGDDGTTPRGQVTVGNYGGWEMESLGSVNNGWNHVVVTYDGKGSSGSQGTAESQGTWAIYINGFLDNSTGGAGANEAALGAGAWPISIGYEGNMQFPSVSDGELDTTTLNGKIDEVAVWNEALSPDQAAYVYVFGVPTQSINITTQPTNVPAKIAGATATFYAAATGYGIGGSVTYQWMKNGVAIPGATGQSYTTPPLPAAADGLDYTVSYSCEFTVGSVSVVSGAATVAVSTPSLPPAPALWLPLNHSLADLGVDGSSHVVQSNNISGGTYTGTFTSDSPNASAGSGSLTLSGGSFVQVTNVGDLDFDDGPLTITAWVNPQGSDDVPILGMAPPGSVISDWHVFQAFIGNDPDLDPAAHFQMTIGNYYDWDGQSTGNLASSGWTHVAITYDGNLWSLYLNGNLDTTFTAPGSNQGDVIDDSGPWDFLVGFAGETDQFPDATLVGEISQVAVWTSALTGGQVAYVYQHGIRPTLSLTILDSSHVSVSWAESGFKLQQNSNLSNPAGWTDVSGGGASPVSVAIGAGSEFFRLVNK